MSARDFWKLIFEPEIKVSCIRETAAPEPVGGLNLSINMCVLLRTCCSLIQVDCWVLTLLGCSYLN